MYSNKIYQGELMKTNVVMESIDRELCGRIVRQRTKDSFMALNDILAIGKLYRLNNNLPEMDFAVYMRTENVKNFLAELEKETGTKPYIKTTKSNTGWVHPYFAIKILLHFNPKFEVQVYKWLWDFLIQNRKDSGDSYTKMCGILFRYTTDKLNFGKNIKNANRIIKDLIGVDDWNTATAEQLLKRDRLYNSISDLTRACGNSSAGLNMALRLFKEDYALLAKKYE